MSNLSQSLLNTVTTLAMSDADRTILNAAIISSLAQLETPAPIPHKPLKPTCYNGKVDALSSLNFIEGLEEYFTIVELPAQKWVPYAVGYLGEARGWWRSTKHHVDTTSWINFKAMFLKQYTPPDSINAARRRLSSLRQGSRPVLDYITAFDDLLRLLPSLDPDQASYMFTAGLERELSKQVRLSRPSTLEQAIENATCLYDILNTHEPQSLLSSSSSSSHPEPMEVDAVTGYENKQTKNNSWNNNNAWNNNNTWNNRNAWNNNSNNNNKNNNNTSRSNNNTNQRSTSTNNKNTSNNNNHFVNPPPLNQAWRARCQALGLCRRCRQPGHFAIDCPIYALNNFDTEIDPETTSTPPEIIDSSSGKA